jgi:hypothetical protein
VGAIATAIVIAFVPETLQRHKEAQFGRMVKPMAATSDLSVTP